MTTLIAGGFLLMGVGLLLLGYAGGYLHTVICDIKERTGILEQRLQALTEAHHDLDREWHDYQLSEMLAYDPDPYEWRSHEDHEWEFDPERDDPFAEDDGAGPLEPVAYPGSV